MYKQNVTLLIHPILFVYLRFFVTVLTNFTLMFRGNEWKHCNTRCFQILVLRRFVNSCIAVLNNHYIKLLIFSIFLWNGSTVQYNLCNNIHIFLGLFLIIKLLYIHMLYNTTFHKKHTANWILLYCYNFPLKSIVKSI